MVPLSSSKSACDPLAHIDLPYRVCTDHCSLCKSTNYPKPGIPIITYRVQQLSAHRTPPLAPHKLKNTDSPQQPNSFTNALFTQITAPHKYSPNASHSRSAAPSSRGAFPISDSKKEYNGAIPTHRFDMITSITFMPIHLLCRSYFDVRAAHTHRNGFTYCQHTLRAFEVKWCRVTAALLAVWHHYIPFSSQR